MGLFEWARNQFIEIIEWVDDSRNTLVYRFPVYRKEIKQGAQLTVREGQAAVFVSEGAIADVFGPGMHKLSTRNLPILATIKGWKYGFESPFKAEVYFVSTRLFTNLKWGTANPIMMRDKDFGVLRLRAFGTYAMRVNDAGNFLKQHVSTSGHLDADAITSHLRNLVVSRFADHLAETEIPALDLAAKYDEIGFDLQKKLNDTFHEQGLGLENLAVENISLPPEVEEALDTRSKMAVIGDLNRFTQFQTANSIPTAAANQGVAGAGMGMGVGFGMGNMMAHQMGQVMMPGAQQSPNQDPFAAQAAAQQQTQATAAPAAAPAAPPQESPQERLKKIAGLLEQGLISDEEAQALRTKVLESL